MEYTADAQKEQAGCPFTQGHARKSFVIRRKSHIDEFLH